MKTTIIKTADNEVTLSAVDPMTKEVVTWVFWIPNNGGYVRKGERHTANDPQVCKGLSRRGSTLHCIDGDDLLATIRSEWAVYRKWAAVA